MNRFDQGPGPRRSIKISRCRGSVWIDTLVGLALLAALVAALAGTHIRYRKTSKAMAEQRAAVRLLEVQAGRLLAGRERNDPRVMQEAAGEGWWRLSRQTARGEVELWTPRGVASSPADHEVSP